MLVGNDEGRESLPSAMECHFGEPDVDCIFGEIAADLPLGGVGKGGLFGDPLGVISGVTFVGVTENF